MRSVGRSPVRGTIHVSPVGRSPVRGTIHVSPVGRSPVDRSPVRSSVHIRPVPRGPVDRSPVDRSPIRRTVYSSTVYSSTVRDASFVQPPSQQTVVTTVFFTMNASLYPGSFAGCVGRIGLVHPRGIGQGPITRGAHSHLGVNRASFSPVLLRGDAIRDGEAGRCGRGTVAGHRRLRSATADDPIRRRSQCSEPTSRHCLMRRGRLASKRQTADHDDFGSRRGRPGAPEPGDDRRARSVSGAYRIQRCFDGGRMELR
jgi:hypothetical protein